MLRPLHYKSALGSEEEVLRDFLRVWTYIMTAYYVYLLVTTLFGVARAAMQIGQLRVLLLQGHLLLKVALAALLVISFSLHLVLEPAVKSCAECEVDSLRDLAAINYSDLSQLRRPDGRWDAVSLPARVAFLFLMLRQAFLAKPDLASHWPVETQGVSFDQRTQIPVVHTNSDS